jgi:hypothetical protein
MYLNIVVPGFWNGGESAKNCSRMQQLILVRGKGARCQYNRSEELTMHMLKDLEASIRNTRNICDVRDCRVLAILSATLRIESNNCACRSAKTCHQHKE